MKSLKINIVIIIAIFGLLALNLQLDQRIALLKSNICKEHLFGTLFVYIFCSGADYALFGAVSDKFGANLALKLKEIMPELNLLVVLFGTNLLSNISKKAPYLMLD